MLSEIYSLMKVPFVELRVGKMKSQIQMSVKNIVYRYL